MGEFVFEFDSIVVVLAERETASDVR